MEVYFHTDNTKKKQIYYEKNTFCLKIYTTWFLKDNLFKLLKRKGTAHYSHAFNHKSVISWFINNTFSAVQFRPTASNERMTVTDKLGIT